MAKTNKVLESGNRFFYNGYINTGKSLVYETNRLGYYTLRSVPFEDIFLNKTIEQRRPNYRFVVLPLVWCALVALVWLLGPQDQTLLESVGPAGLALLIMLGVGYAFPVTRLVLPTKHDSRVVIEYSARAQQRITAFMDQLRADHKTYMVEKFAQIDPQLPIDTQLNHLLWLKNSEVITKEEFDQIKHRALGVQEEALPGVWVSMN